MKQNKKCHLKTTLSRKQAGANWKAFLNESPHVDVEKKQGFQRLPHKYTKDAMSTRNNRVIKNKAGSRLGSPQPISNIKDPSYQPAVTKYLAMDCEMVGIGDGFESMLARISIVNSDGECLYDKFVKPREMVVDYRTHVSGIHPEDVKHGEDFLQVVRDVSDMLKHRILVGHDLKHDLAVLFLSHPKRHIRDTSRYKPFRTITNGKTPSLKRLASELLGLTIQTGEHSPVEDARVAMQLYNMHKKDWEKSLISHRRS